MDRDTLVISCKFWIGLNVGALKAGHWRRCHAVAAVHRPTIYRSPFLSAQNTDALPHLLADMRLVKSARSIP